MFDIGWTEMALIAVVAVIVIGPKELPKVMRELGTWISRARAMSRSFMDQLDEMSRQSGIEEVRKEAEALRQLNPARQLEKTIDPEGVIGRQSAELARAGAFEDKPQVTSDPPPVPVPAPPPAEVAPSEPPAVAAEPPPRRAGEGT